MLFSTIFLNTTLPLNYVLLYSHLRVYPPASLALLRIILFINSVEQSVPNSAVLFQLLSLLFFNTNLPTLQKLPLNRRLGLLLDLLPFFQFYLFWLLKHGS